MDKPDRVKILRWAGSSRRDLKSFPRQIRLELGQALYTAQRGATDPAAKPLKGFGGRSVLEIVAPFDGDTWRAVCWVGFEAADIDLIRKRLADAERDYKQRQN